MNNRLIFSQINILALFKLNKDFGFRMITLLLIAIISIPYLYFIARGLNSILPIFVIWLFVGFSKLIKSIRVASNNAPIILVSFTLIILNFFVHYYFDHGPDGFRILNIMIQTIIVFAILLTITTDVKFYIFILLMIITYSVINAAFTLPILILNPFAARTALSTYAGYSSNINYHFLKLLGVDGFAIFVNYSITANLILGILFSSGTSVSIKRFFIIGLVILLLTVFFSSLVGVSLFSILITIIILILGWKNIIKYKISFSSFFILSIIIILLLNNKENIVIQSQFRKLESFYYSASTFGLGEIDPNGRSLTAQASLTSFNENPLIGVGLYWEKYDIIGNHNFWFDILGMFGTIGFIIYLIFWLSVLFRIITLYRKSNNQLILSFLVIILGLAVYGIFNPIFLFPKIEFYILLIAAFAATSDARNYHA